MADHGFSTLESQLLLLVLALAQPFVGGLLFQRAARGGYDNRMIVDSRRLLHNASRQPLSADFFTRDAEMMDELPPAPVVNTSLGCHPKCTWDCGVPECNGNCRAVCQPPKCATTCKKPKVSPCRQVCKDPQCTVVCPQQKCEHGTCPDCITVCNPPQCMHDCGNFNFCESRCEDPECSWQCKNDVCPEPVCKLRCEAPKLGCKGDNTLKEQAKLKESTEQLRLSGWQEAWSGLGRVPTEQLAVAKAPEFPKVLPLPGAQPLPGPAGLLPGSSCLPCRHAPCPCATAQAKIITKNPDWQFTGKEDPAGRVPTAPSLGRLSPVAPVPRWGRKFVAK